MIAFLVSAILAQAAAPIARARVGPPGPVTVGQPVSIEVEVLVPNYFMGAPRFPDIDLPDALVIFEARGTNFTERVGSETFAAQSRRYTVYPQRAGSFEVDAIEVAVRFFGESGPVDAVVTAGPVRFEARLPPEAEGLGYFIGATNLTLDSVLTPETTELRVGDAVTRTVTITVEGALSMVIPPFVYEPIEGLAVYPSPPVVSDRGGARGEPIVGTRVEAATYVAEEEGSYVLPGVELSWWDVNKKRLRTRSVPAVDLTVAPNPELVAEREEEETTAAPSPDGVLPLVLGGLVLLLFLAGMSYFRRREKEEPSEPSEAASFRRFRRAALSGEPQESWRALVAWLDSRHGGVARVREFVDEASDPELEREVLAVEALMYGGPGEPTRWSGRRLYRRVAAVRRRRQHGSTPPDRLPPLNPVRPC